MQVTLNEQVARRQKRVVIASKDVAITDLEGLIKRARSNFDLQLWNVH